MKGPNLEVDDVYLAVAMLETQQKALYEQSTSEQCRREGRSLERVIQHLKEQILYGILRRRD